MTILLVTNAEDSWTASAVHDALAAEGADVLCLEADRFPSPTRLAAHARDTGDSGRLVTRDRVVELDSVTAVWHRRRNNAVAASSLRLPEDIQQGIARESDASFGGVIEALPCFHLDDPGAVLRARNRPLQLTLARRLGLRVPRTLTTNDPQEALRFFDECGGNVVVKMLSSFGVRGQDNREKIVMTSGVTAEHLSHIESLSLCPMTFQERIPKALELRITIVGFEVFAAAVDSGIEERAQVDWRRGYDELRSHWRPYELPTELRARLLSFLDRLQMNYGAIDLILTPEGRHVFLETNPLGQFGWIETATGMRIAEAVAGLLTGRLPRRVDVPALTLEPAPVQEAVASIA